MNKRTCLGVVLVLVFPALAGACTNFVQIPAASAGAPTLGGSPVNVGTGTGQPVVPVATGPNAAAQAPICDATASCAALDAEQIPLDCVKKVPYTNVLVPKGTTFQVLDTSGSFACVDSGVIVNDKQVITCHGEELYSFQLKLVNAACGGSLQVGTSQCQEGYGFDAAQQCCSPVNAAGAGTATVSVNLGACPAPAP